MGKAIAVALAVSALPAHLMAQTPAAPVETSVTGLFAAIGPVRWGVLLLALCLGAIAVSCLVFLTMPLDRRRQQAASLSSLKEWNTVLSTLCTVLGPVGTYIGMIGALKAMHRVAIAADSAARLAAQAEFFGQAAHMFVSSLAGIGVGLGLGLVNSLLLHHVLPEHRHPIEGQGMVAASASILRRWAGGGAREVDAPDRPEPAPLALPAAEAGGGR